MNVANAFAIPNGPVTVAIVPHQRPHAKRPQTISSVLVTGSASVVAASAEPISLVHFVKPVRQTAMHCAATTSHAYGVCLNAEKV